MTGKIHTTCLLLLATLAIHPLLQGCASRQGSPEGDLLDNKVTAQRISGALKKGGSEFKHIHVEATKEGVTLSGTVRSADERSRAEEVAKSVQRSMDLKNELQVKE